MDIVDIAGRMFCGPKIPTVNLEPSATLTLEWMLQITTPKTESTVGKINPVRMLNLDLKKNLLAILILFHILAT
jgi:hypothetical protein